MTFSFLRGLPRFLVARGVVALVLGTAALMAVPASADAAPDGEAAASTKRVVASDWGTTWKPLRAESTAADFPSGNVYCTPSTATGCLQPLKGVVEYLGCGTESGGGDIDIVVRNRNRAQAPRDISVFVLVPEGGSYRMIFGDRDWAQKGKNVVEYRGLPSGTYMVTVGWDDQRLAFYGDAFTVAC